jgi:hypothetical protein
MLHGMYSIKITVQTVSKLTLQLCVSLFFSDMYTCVRLLSTGKAENDKKFVAISRTSVCVCVCAA